MPDWSYRTILRPLLFRLPPATGRDLSLRAMGMLARSPLGPLVIDFLGHMRPDPRLGREHLGLRFPGSVGLGAGIDPAGMGTPALARFGLGFVELGPVKAAEGVRGEIGRRPDREEISASDPPESVGVAALADRLARDGRMRVPVFVRLVSPSGSPGTQVAADFRSMARGLEPHIDAISLAIAPDRGYRPPTYLADVIDAARSGAPSLPVLVVLPADLAPDAAEVWVDAVRSAGVSGVIIDGGLHEQGGGRRYGPDSSGPARGLVGRLREHWSEGVLIGSGGIHSPFDALLMLESGADLVQIDSGLVYSGPGLPKRINDAVLARDFGGGAAPSRRAAPKMTWFWAMLMGLGMLIGSFMALAIASTRVVLPYDEHFVGLGRAEIAAINPHLLDFMAHDRATLAGVMTTVGVLYFGLSAFGIRRGLHWAMVSVVASAAVGFASFFLFLGFGYLDPFHAFVSVVLLQFLLMAVHSDLGEAEVLPTPSLFNDRDWRLSQWGQLLVIVQSVLFLAAGLVISAVGVSRVFVPEDLAFMGTTPEQLAIASPRLIPLIAHDRASLGGMLVCSGLAFLLPALWGYQRGRRWLWWILAIAAVPGFLATSLVHLEVGYHDPRHLAPVFLGSALMGLGLALSYPFLRGGDAATEQAWAELRARSRVPVDTRA